MENDSEVTTQETSTETTENTQDVDVEELKKQLATTIAQKEHFKKLATERKVDAQANLSLGDIKAITNAKITDEDMDRVEWFASSNNISIREAINHPEMKAILALREEQRMIAQATNIENVRRGSVKQTDEALIVNARMGKLPTSDDDIEALVQARLRKK